MDELSPPPAAPATIVVADTRESFGILSAMLAGASPLLAAESLEKARQLVTAGTSLVICGCHFDEGRMYDLLRWMRARTQSQATPFLAIRVLEGGLDDALYESVKIATDALGGNGFIDLYRWQRKYGPEKAAAQLADVVNALAAGSQPEWAASK